MGFEQFLKTDLIPCDRYNKGEYDFFEYKKYS